MNQTIEIKCPIHENKNISHISISLENTYPNRFICIKCYQLIMSQSNAAFYDFVELETFLNDATAPLINISQRSKYHITYQEIAQQISLDIDYELQEVSRQLRLIFDQFSIILQEHVQKLNNLRQTILLIKSNIADDSKHKNIFELCSQNKSNYQELDKIVLNHIQYFQKAPNDGLWKKFTTFTDYKQYDRILQEFQQVFRAFNAKFLNTSYETISQLNTKNLQYQFVKSKLLSEEFHKKVIDKIHRHSQISSASKLLYRGIQDKLNYDSFSNKIKNHGPLLFIIKTDSDIIGGFAAVKIQKAGSLESDRSQRSFLFSQKSSKIYKLKEGNVTNNSQFLYSDFAVQTFRETSSFTFAFGLDLIITKQFEVKSEEVYYQLSGTPLTPQTDIIDMEIFEIA